MNSTLNYTGHPNRAAPVLHFTWAMLKAARNNWRDLALALFTPMLILVLFSVLSDRNRSDDVNLAAASFPAIVGLTAMLGSNFVAVRIVSWRQQGVFQRLACTPTPLGGIVIGMGLAQAINSSAQSTLVIVFGVAVLGLPLNGPGALIALGVLMLGAVCFIAYGMLIASLSRKPDTASALVMFTVLPMFFLSGVFPERLLPPFLLSLSPLLPATMLNSLLSSLMTTGSLPAHSLTPVLGLVAYTLVFAFVAAWQFKWE